MPRWPAAVSIRPRRSHPACTARSACPNRGVLTESAELPPRGPGFVRYRQQSTHYFGRPRLVSALESAAASVARLAPRWSAFVDWGLVRQDRRTHSGSRFAPQRSRRRFAVHGHDSSRRFGAQPRLRALRGRRTRARGRQLRLRAHRRRIASGSCCARCSPRRKSACSSCSCATRSKRS